MKIIYIANSFIPSRMANSIHVMKMCQAMVALGHELTLLTFSSLIDEEQGVDDVFEYYGVNTKFKIKKISLKKIKGKMHFFAMEAIKYCKSQNPDLVYTRCEIPALYLSLTALPFVVEAHKPFIDQAGFLKPLFKRLFLAKNLKRFVAISSALKQMFLKHFEPGQFNSMVLHDAADFVKKTDERSIQWQGRNDVLQLGYFGHLYQGRGVELIIEAAEQLPAVDFQIIGGQKQDVRYWQDEAAHLDNIYFYGFVNPSDVPNYRSKCDVLLAPYQREVWVANKGHESSKYMSPLKIFEYMSSRRCIICSDIPVLREVLNSKNANLVSPDNVREWIEAIRLCEKEEYRKKFADEAYRNFIERYTWDKRAELALKGVV